MRDHCEAVELRHVDVEEDDVGPHSPIASMASFACEDSPASRKSVSRVSSIRSV